MSKVTKQILLSVALAGALAAVTGTTFSAFSATTSAGAASISAGTVTLTGAGGDGGSVPWSLRDAMPGDSVTRCHRVTYTGSLPATVRLRGATTGTGLARYLSLRVTRGTGSVGPDGACAGFTADATGSELFDGRLGEYPSTYATAIVDPDRSWRTADSAVYRFVLTQDDDPAARGLTASTTLTWEARGE